MIRHQPIQGESNIDFLRESEGSLPPPHDSFRDVGEAINAFWSMSRNCRNRHHVEPRVKLYSPREESFPIPLKYIDVSRTTQTNLDVKQEKRIDDCWNIDGSRDLSDSFKGIIKNARRKVETPMAPAVPCKTYKKNKRGEIRSKTNDFKSKFACILEASESTRMRMEESLPKYHEDHIVGKGNNSLQHHNLEHKFIPVPQAMKIPAAKAAVNKEWEKLEKIPAWNIAKVRNKSDVIDEARKEGRKVHFASLMDICHLKNAELETKHQKYKGRVVLRGDIVKDESGSYAVRTRTISITNDSSKSHGYHLQIARLRRTSSRRSICLHPGENAGCSQTIENSKTGMSRHLDSSTPTQMAKIMVQYGRPSCSSRKESVRSPFGRTIMGKAI